MGRVSKLPDPEVLQAEVAARSIAASPFPEKMGMEKVEAIFKPHAKVPQATIVWNLKSPKHGFVMFTFLYIYIITTY